MKAVTEDIFSGMILLSKFPSVYLDPFSLFHSMSISSLMLVFGFDAALDLGPIFSVCVG